MPSKRKKKTEPNKIQDTIDSMPKTVYVRHPSSDFCDDLIFDAAKCIDDFVVSQNSVTVVGVYQLIGSMTVCRENRTVESFDYDGKLVKRF